ncbi:MAG: UvrD-helicase domain-containing protein [Endomicrobia bacterium]|nr:UvrD-helicase domain-containing protein [Endomicrobiia bacterium]MCL2507438.1 UvrD-helicase domain-containing protein [Endomicrobiia bacterium]
MFFYADLHIHSKYSRATSKSCNLEELAIWAQKKGLTLITTGDFTHPAWFAEIKEKLVPAGPGVFKLRDDIEKQIVKDNKIVRFVLSVEISTIYKKGDKTRKVHHIVFVPDFNSAEKLRQKLSAVGNIVSDGRPILGLDSRNLLEITLESGEGSFIVPAHIWTPWFSVLGSKSGFDSVKDCYADLADHIFAVETGLSSDPEMNYRVSSLDKYRLISNSDAHSPSKLAREATVFDTDPDYFSIMKALQTGKGYVGTVEFFPEEGKYHEDGHRKCNVCLSPEETVKLKGICPVCNKPLTIGVLNRVNELADRKGSNLIIPKTAGKTFSLVPLQEILSEIIQVGVSSNAVNNAYENLIQKLGPELSILREIPVNEISKNHSSLLGEAISRLRAGKVIRQAGFDGEYGVIKLFEQDELNSTNLMFDMAVSAKPKKKDKETTSSVIPEGFYRETTFKNGSPIQTFGDDKTLRSYNDKGILSGLDEYQLSVVKNNKKQLLIIAGPGSGKTTVLTKRIAFAVSENNISPENCLAITFTRRAAKEMQDRLNLLLTKNYSNVNVHTFHSLCFSILKENASKAGLNLDFKVASKEEMSLSKSDDNMLGFDDLISLTLKLLNDNPDIAKSYKETFKYISIDEYQDIDETQYELIRLLTHSNANLCVIGDPNQAIYGFRGGDSKFFNNFTKDYPDAEIINLKNNYRSTETIVNASNQIVDSHNIIAKYDRPHEKITIHTAPTDKAEAEFVVSTIEKMIGGHSFFSIDTNRSAGEETNLSFSDFAVLYRSASQLPPIIEALKRSGMPYVKLSNDLLCDKKPVVKLLSLLTDEKPVIEQLGKLNKEFSDKIDDNILQYFTKLAQTYTTKNEFIHEVSMLSEIDTLDKRADRISLLTLHSSKGLEFKCVFIVGLEQDIIPFYRAKTQDEKEEERRLLYVGMTRAEQRLFLTRSIKRKWLGTYKKLAPSPFLEKIENDLLKFSKIEKALKAKEQSRQLDLF